MIDDYKMKDILAILSAEIACIEMAEAIGFKRQYSALLNAFERLCASHYPQAVICPTVSTVSDKDNELDEFEFSVRASNVLGRIGLRTIAEVLKVTDGELLRTEGCGRRTLQEIRDVIREVDTPEKLAIYREIKKIKADEWKRSIAGQEFNKRWSSGFPTWPD